MSVLRRVRHTLRPRTRWRAWRGRTSIATTPTVKGWPAGFAEWTRRQGGPRLGAFPAEWRNRADLPIERPSRIAVVVHAFYPDLLDELFDRVRRIPAPYDLFVTNATGESLHLPDEMGELRNARVLDIENRGRDILPLVHLVNAGYLDPYLVVLKLHTKRSEWRGSHPGFSGDGEGWRSQLLDALTASSDQIAHILTAFSERPDLGVLTAPGSVLGPDYWGGNEALVSNLLRRIELELEPEQLSFPAGSMYWARGFVVQGLRSLNLNEHDFEAEQGQINATTAHAVERLIGILANEAGLSVIEGDTTVPSDAARTPDRLVDAPLRPRARVIPFYLPQYHPVPENDRWWGKGFTEWTNVASSKPLYDGHYQPRLPRDLGFYDLRLDEVRREQYSMSFDHGMSGLMYYFYWFAGKRLLEAPIEALLKSDVPQPFCIMWANENWTRRWDGRESEVLIGQNYERVPAENFIDDLLPLLADDRYMTIGDRKIVAIYRPGQIRDLPGVVDAWRKRARIAGVGELCIMSVEVDVDFGGLAGSLASHGLDGSLGFPPHGHLYSWLSHDGLGVSPRFEGNLLSYKDLVEDAERRLRADVRPRGYPGVMVAFDNTPRRSLAPDIWYGSNPYTFRRWLATAVRSVVDRPPDERVVFVNAWNEWAEGAVLEPTDRNGRTFLLAVRDVAFG